MADILSEIKHPLHDSWTMYMSSTTITKGRASSQDEWKSQTQTIYTFSTIEDFWRLWNNLPLGTELSFGSDYFLFRNTIQPAWEDEHNLGGGRFLLRFDRYDGQDNTKTEKYWLWTLLALIGETIERSELVNGANFSLRRQGIKVAIWVKKCDDATLRGIGADIRRVLSIPAEAKIPYEVHGVTATVFVS